MNPIQQLLTENIGLWTGADTAKKSGRGRASGSAGTVYGIKKLRKLILELAVRGKLVPQDTNDEPASALLERIRAEKARLVLDGKSKKDKPVAAITDDEKLFALPQGWEWIRILSIAELITSGSRDWAQHLSEDGAKFVTMGNLSRGSYDLRLENMRYVNVPKNGEGSRTKLEENDLLISITGDVGNLGRIPPNFGDGYINQHTCLLRFIPQCRNRYFPEFMRSPMAISQFNAPQRGIKNSFRLGDVNEIILPLPPLAEQHRIVAKVDELMALCDRLEAGQIDAADAHEKLVNHLLATLTSSQDSADFSASWQRIATHFDMLFTTEASIDALKQTLLQLAVMGKLVPQDPSDEPASALLERIQAEKAKLVFEGKIKKEKALAAISDDEKPFKLPQGWEWVRLGVALEITGGVTLGRKLNDTDLIELPYLRVANVQRGYLDLDSIKMVEIRRSELARYQILNNDLLVTEGGDWDKVGRTAIWSSEIEVCVHQNHIFRMRIKIEQLSSSWIEMYMNSIAKAYFQNASKQTTNLASINMTQLKNCLLAVPALEEQHRIVAKVDELMALCDRMKTRIADASALQRKLADVMVAQAVA